MRVAKDDPGIVYALSFSGSTIKIGKSIKNIDGLYRQYLVPRYALVYPKLYGYVETTGISEIEKLAKTYFKDIRDDYVARSRLPGSGLDILLCEEAYPISPEQAVAFLSQFGRVKSYTPPVLRTALETKRLHVMMMSRHGLSRGTMLRSKIIDDYFVMVSTEDRVVSCAEDFRTGVGTKMGGSKISTLCGKIKMRVEEDYRTGEEMDMWEVAAQPHTREASKLLDKIRRQLYITKIPDDEIERRTRNYVFEQMRAGGLMNAR